MMRRTVALVVAALVVVGGGAWFARDTGADDPAPSSQAAPGSGTSAATDEPFELFDGTVARVADWQGTPVIVNFWASWCPPCVAEMREAFEPAHQEFGDDVLFLGLNLQDTPQRAQDIVERTGVTYTLGWDPAGILFTAFGGFGMPTTIFIDADGEIVSTHTGALTSGQLRNLIQTSLLDA